MADFIIINASDILLSMLFNLHLKSDKNYRQKLWEF